MVQETNVVEICKNRLGEAILKCPQDLLLGVKRLCIRSHTALIGILNTTAPVWQHTFVSPSAFSRRAVVSYWRKYVHEVLVNRLGGLSLPRKSVVRLTDRPDMTLDVYRGRKTTNQQYNGILFITSKR